MLTEAARIVDTQDHPGFRTTCGRAVRVGRLPLGGPDRPVWRVSLDIGQSPDGDHGTWAGLTSAEARRLAATLLAQAAAIDRSAADGAVARSAARDDGEGRIDVAHVSGESYAITTRGHAVLVDQPTQSGGADAAPTPTELLVAALASCVAFYSGRYLVRHGLGRDGLRVTSEFTMATDRPARVGAVRLRIHVPASVPEQRQAALLAVASHCTVHNTLRQEPGVAIELA
jgi:putative redox protein